MLWLICHVSVKGKTDDDPEPGALIGVDASRELILVERKRLSGGTVSAFKDHLPSPENQATPL